MKWHYVDVFTYLTVVIEVIVCVEILLVMVMMIWTEHITRPAQTVSDSTSSTAADVQLQTTHTR